LSGIPQALSAGHFVTLQALVEAIIPTDERSPGARDAGVAEYIDLWLTEADEPVRLEWRAGLAALDSEAVARFGQAFAQLEMRSVDMLMATISENERAPQTLLEKFFVSVKAATIRGYYTSPIGIHEELRYKGNQQLPQFVGCATEDGQDCPHCGQRPDEPKETK
jgi:hypothetical protein